MKYIMINLILLNFRTWSFLSLLFLFNTIYGQNRPAVRSRAGLPELIQTGFYAPAGPCQVGISFGTGFENEASVTVDILYYFGPKFEQHTMPSMYFRTAINYLTSPASYENPKPFRAIHVPLWMGFEYVPKRLGVFIEAGPGIYLFRENFIAGEEKGLGFFSGAALGLIYVL